MLAAAVTAIVRVCARVPWLIIVLGLAAAAASAVYSARHFAINTDVNKLISPDLDWRKRELEFERLFPGHFGSTLVVVDAPTAELAAQASADLTRRLAAQPKLFTSVEDMAGNAFFSRNGLLFRPADDVVRLTQGLRQAGPLIGTLVADPSLRGLTRALSLVFIGVQNHSTTLDALAPTLSMAATTFEDVLAGRPAAFSWQELLVGHPPAVSDLRRLIEVHPVLDYSALQPGQRLERCHPAGRQGARSRRQIPRARAADRLGADGRRGIRHRAAGRAGQRPRHRRHRAGDPVAGVEVGAHHRRGVHQPVRRPDASPPRSG